MELVGICQRFGYCTVQLYRMSYRWEWLLHGRTVCDNHTTGNELTMNLVSCFLDADWVTQRKYEELKTRVRVKDVLAHGGLHISLVGVSWCQALQFKNWWCYPWLSSWYFLSETWLRFFLEWFHTGTFTDFCHSCWDLLPPDELWLCTLCVWWMHRNTVSLWSGSKHQPKRERTWICSR